MPRVRSSRDSSAALPFILPFLALYLLFLVLPFVRGIWMSLHDWDLLSAAAGLTPRYVGLDNYRLMIEDRHFWSSLGHTALFVVLAVPSITAAGLALALLLNRATLGSALFRNIVFASGALSVSVLTLIWVMVLNPARGLMSQLWPAFGLAPVDVLAHPRLAMPALVLTTLWWSAGFPMALFLAALQHIPRELYEAAALDDAGPWRRFRHITLPSIRRTLWLVITVECILQVQVFGQVLLMTHGGPANATRVLVQYMYETGFRDWDAGYAAALSLVLFGFTMLASLVQFKLTRTREVRG